MRSVRRFFGFASSGRWQALLTATLAAFASILVAAAAMVFPPFILLVFAGLLGSAAVVALTVLRQGPMEGALVALGPSLLWLWPVFSSGQGEGLEMVIPAETLRALAWLPFMGAVVAGLLPAMFATWVLRVTHSQGGALLGAMLAIGTLVTLLTLASIHPSEWIFEHFRTLVEVLREEASMPPLAAADQPVMPADVGLGAHASVSLLWVVAIVLAGRWAHATLDNPGGFGKEFRALALDWRLAVVAAGLAALSFFGGRFGDWAASLLPLVLCGFVLQALAVAHALVRKRGASWGWLLTLYVLLVLPPFIVISWPLAAIVGVADCWLNFRARAGAND